MEHSCVFPNSLPVIRAIVVFISFFENPSPFRILSILRDFRASKIIYSAPIVLTFECSMLSISTDVNCAGV
ncbi:hypothetical protein DESACE_05615 [Desulfurella acetivorans A63]|nr:hypothetical protein DESACE_05615 [Desulfurella acetivorans A63]